MKTSTRISLIFSFFTFFVVLFLIVFINLFSYINWHKSEEKEIPKLGHNNSEEIKYYIEEQLESIELEIFLLFFLTLLSYILSKFLFVRLILKDIFYISDNLQSLDLNNLGNDKIGLKASNEINIIINSINRFLEIIYRNTKTLKEFNSQVSHEFKTPLMVISSELEVLSLSGKDNKSFKKIEEQINILNNLLETFLFLSKIDSMLEVPKKDNINIYQIISDEVNKLEIIYKTKKIKIINKLSKKINLRTNKKLFLILVKNLLDNAFKYNKDGGEIIIVGDENYISFKDKGIGIKKSEIPKIFNNLYRINSISKGYGIGLSIVKKITKILGYKIEVKSEFGKGSDFCIFFK